MVNSARVGINIIAYLYNQFLKTLLKIKMDVSALKKVFVSMVALLLFSCGEEEKRPEDILDEEQMINMMIDTMIVVLVVTMIPTTKTMTIKVALQQPVAVVTTTRIQTRCGRPKGTWAWDTNVRKRRTDKPTKWEIIH